MRASKIDGVRLIHDKVRRIGIIYSHGYCYASAFAPDVELTDDLVKKAWRSPSRLKTFRPFNESTLTFL